ncbi:hypothetical protein GXW78_07160 [Roseomonas terrae]|uniref:Regulatory protein RecX n=1 Tax=Neoroseomonas terrae TaxID=424799 RepID=A0ABS5EEI1_9PROT|nr:hypothetical protein [Neoroseomonas terrae]MBR0649436.1 hypothetical protein [Neoroseomonas terrae]
MSMMDGTDAGRFGELVRLHTQGRRFLNQEEERRLLEEGVTRYRLRLEEARGIVRAAAAEADMSLEHEVNASAAQLLKTLADRRQRIARKDFDKAVAFYRARSGRNLTPADAQRRVKRLMEEAELKPARSGRILRTRRWYRQIAD